MVDNSSNSNALVAFFSNIVGEKDFWIFWVAVSVAAWIGFILSSSFLLLLVGIATSTVVIISALISVYRTRKKEHIRKLQIELDAKNKANADSAEAERHATLVWKYVAHADDNYLSIASALLSFERHDNSDFIRFIRNPENDFSDEAVLFKGILAVVPYFCFHLNYGNELRLLYSEMIREGHYVYIDPYFYLLLKNYKESGQWIKLPIK